MEAAAQANFVTAVARDLAHRELGNCSQLPLIFYAGIALPDLVALWRKNTERQLEALDRAELPKPPTPPARPRSQPYPSPDDPPLIIATAWPGGVRRRGSRPAERSVG
jgi:hypothetical protein